MDGKVEEKLGDHTRMQCYKWDNTCPGDPGYGTAWYGIANGNGNGNGGDGKGKGKDKATRDSVGKAQVVGGELGRNFGPHWRADWANEEPTGWLADWLTFELQAVKAVEMVGVEGKMGIYLHSWVGGVWVSQRTLNTNSTKWHDLNWLPSMNAYKLVEHPGLVQEMAKITGSEKEKKPKIDTGWGGG